MHILIAIGVQRVREAGAAGVAFNQAEELEKLGHQVELWFLDDILSPARWPARFNQMEFAAAISRRIRREPSRFDVVNIHAPWGAVYGFSHKWFSSDALPPYVFTMQGSEERYVWAMRMEHKKGKVENFAWKNRAWHRLYHQTMYDFSISTADFGNVANREGWILSELKYKHPSGRVWYVPNGVGPQFFLPRSFNDSGALRLLYVGTWLDRKGIYYLVDSFKELAPKLPQVTLTVAGCLVSEEDVKKYFPPEIKSRVNVLPRLNREVMPELYAAHDIFVFPSLMEGMPLTLLEAMAATMPVVTTNTCGMADVVENEFNGLLVPAADSAALTYATQRLCQDLALRKSLGLAAQESARHYTWPNVVRQLEHILKLAVQQRRGSPR
jgi:glycosyltransferase involved in cell wall biosynthesis